MSAGSVNVKMNVSKPPPPVPPRPSKTLIKEALAKTRQAYEVASHNHGKFPSQQNAINQDHVDNERTTSLKKHSTSFNRPRKLPLTDDNSRPVVYQSDNCKSRLKSIETTPKTPNNKQQSEKSVNLYENSTAIHQELINKTQNSKKIIEEKKIANSEVKRQSSFSSDTNNKENKKNEDRSESAIKVTNETSKAEINFRDQNNQGIIRKTSSDEEVASILSSNSSPTPTKNNTNLDDIINNRNHVNTLIDEMFASVLEVNISDSASTTSSTESIIKEENNKITISTHTNSDENLTVIVINEDGTDKNVSSGTESTASTFERKVKFNDQQNHEYLISELQNMKKQEDKVLKRQRLSPLRLDENDTGSLGDKIQRNDWYGVNDGKKVKMSSCQIKIEDNFQEIDADYQKIITMSQAYGLPPLPKSLSGFKFSDHNSENTEKNEVKLNSRFSQYDRKEEISDGVSVKEPTKLDKQLALLRREMETLREQDLTLLSKLWFLNESIQDFRQMLQEQDEKLNLVLSPSPTPSSIDDEDFYPISTSKC